MKTLFSILFLLTVSLSTTFAQSNEQHIAKLSLKEKQKKVFKSKNRDSTLVLNIDTLILKDQASLQFFALKDVKIFVKHAEIGDRVFISGIGSQNNASNFDIDMNIQKLGSLQVYAKGQDAMNGTRTYPNGDGGNVNFYYHQDGVTPQSNDKRGKHYLHITSDGGGKSINPQSDMTIIMDRVLSNTNGRMGGLPQGQVYSGSAGIDGKVLIEEKSSK